MAVVPAVAGQQADGGGAVAAGGHAHAAAPALQACRQVPQQRALAVVHAQVGPQRDLHSNGALACAEAHSDCTLAPWGTHLYLGKALHHPCSLHCINAALL